MKCIAGVALAALALSGCNTVSQFYDAKALQEPLADVSGTWLGQDQTNLVVFRQAGDKVTGEFHDLTILSPQTVSQEIGFFGETWTWTAMPQISLTGKVKGRVVIGELLPVESGGIVTDGQPWHMAPEIAFEVRPDARSGSLALVTPDRAWSRVFHRLSAGQAAPGDPLLAGGTVCTLPVQASGVVATSPNPTATARDVIVTLGYRRTPTLEMLPVRWCIPVEAPRRALFVPYPGAGFFSRTLDRGMFLAARARSPVHRKQSLTLDGKPCWFVINPTWDDGDGELAPSRLEAELYRDDPDSGALPVDVLELARRSPDGAWKPVPAYITGASALLSARLVIEGGRPARVEVADVKEPPLEDFLVTKETEITQARWRTRMLLDAKNLSLPRVLRESKTTELSMLASRIEKLILDLGHEAELLKDSAQRTVEGGGAVPEQVRELTLVYKERIEILKPVLSAIKEEIANRGK